MSRPSSLPWALTRPLGAQPRPCQERARCPGGLFAFRCSLLHKLGDIFAGYLFGFGLVPLRPLDRFLFAALLHASWNALVKAGRRPGALILAGVALSHAARGRGAHPVCPNRLPGKAGLPSPSRRLFHYGYYALLFQAYTARRSEPGLSDLARPCADAGGARRPGADRRDAAAA